jgi:hypothetical protein
LCDKYLHYKRRRTLFFERKYNNNIPIIHRFWQISSEKEPYIALSGFAAEKRESHGKPARPDNDKCSKKKKIDLLVIK